MRRALFFILALVAFARLGQEPAVAQPSPKSVRLGYLAPTRIPHLVEAFIGGLRDFGYIEGQNLSIEYRFAGDDPERFRPSRKPSKEAAKPS